MSKTTSVEIDLTGEELIGIGKACVARSLMFSEFITLALETATYDAIHEEDAKPLSIDDVVRFCEVFSESGLTGNAEYDRGYAAAMHNVVYWIKHHDVIGVDLHKQKRRKQK